MTSQTRYVRPLPIVAAAVLVFILLTGTGSLLFLDLEQDFSYMDMGIHDAFWWSLGTVTAVGYGDIVPTTAAGKGTAILLMSAGYFGQALFTGFLAASLTRRKMEEAHEETKIQLKEMQDELKLNQNKGI